MSQKKYHLFNPESGNHTSFSSVQAAQQAREELLKKKMAEVRRQYAIVEETIYANGDSETRPWDDAALQRITGLRSGREVVEIPEKHPYASHVERF